MRNASISLAAIGSALFFALSATAYAQGGGGGGAGQRTAPRSTPPATQPDRNRDYDQDMDRDRDRDRLQDKDGDMDKDRDRDRLQDRDPLYLGTKDRIRQHDRDGDNKLNQSEFSEWHGAAFASMDTNANGMTLQEFLAMRLGPGPKGSSNPTRQQEIQERAELRKTELFRLMDGDGDGVVSRTEYMKFGKLNYLEADANDDGKLTEKELRQYHRGM